MEFHLTQELLDKIDQYLNGTLEGDALLMFKNQLQENEALREELTLQKMLFKTAESKGLGQGFISTNEVADLQDKIKTPENQDISQKIKAIGQEQNFDTEPVQKTPWIKLNKVIPLAAVFLILIMSTFYLFNKESSLDQYYYDHTNWDRELISMVEKGSNAQDFVVGEKHFKEQNYKKAIQSFETINQEAELYPIALMYLGAAYANLNQNQEALIAFNQLAQLKEFAESSKGLWYAALIHLKMNEKEMALLKLKEITQDSKNYQFEEAKKIIDNLEY